MVGSGNGCQQYVRRQYLGMVDRSMALQGNYRGYYPLSVRLHRLPAFCGRPFRFSLLVINTLITKYYERNNRIFLLSLLRRSDGDLFPPCKHHSFCRWRREPAARSRTLENPSAARRLFRVRFRRTSSMGTPAQAQRPNPIFQVQADENRVLTPKRLRQ